MKQNFVATLQDGQTVTTHFLVCVKEVRATREGKSYLRLELGDSTGRVEARMWDRFDQMASSFECNDYVKVQARVENYRNKLQLAIDKIRRAEESEVDPADFFAHTRENVDEMYARLLQVVASVGNPWLRKLLDRVVQDPEIVPRLKRAPAAKVMHHAFYGGLLEHVLSLCDLCRVVLSHYPEANADLLLTGAVLHDVGKLEELSYERSLGYTDEGQLLGHILLEYESVTKAIDAIDGFPPALKTLVQHMLVSHHGKYEFGSPKLPMFREALMLHYLDDLDSKMAAMRSALESDQGEGNWTAYNGALERRILRTERFLAGAPPESAEKNRPAKTAAGNTAGGNTAAGNTEPPQQ
ncbi:MAG TPA: OB-fold nucleic acid binding domain-containing protein [Candidatus Acidoferrales bacterium]|nr:OB-fold nucleic acid binding domain-containing protein [Candidatus Acidoferrales bacterium]